MGIIINKDKSFTFNGTSSASFGLIVSGGGTYGAPKRSYNKVQIPGRNSSLLIDNGYYEDAEIEYKSVGFVEDFFYPEKDKLEKRIAAVRDWLLSPLGYKRLEDTWHPDEYRMAYISDTFSPTMIDSLEGGMVDLKFTAMPQRFFKSGESYVEIPAESSLHLINPTNMSAIPEFYFTGVCKIEIVSDDNTYIIGISGNALVNIDTDFNAVYDNTLLNSYFYYDLGGKDKLELGKDTTIRNIARQSGVKAYIKPNWWRL